MFNSIINAATRFLAPADTLATTPARRVGGFRGVRPVRGSAPAPEAAPTPTPIAMTTYVFRVTRETGINAIALADNLRDAKVWGIPTLNVRRDEHGVYIAIDSPKAWSRDEVLVSLQTLLDKVYGYDYENDETYSVELEGEEDNLRAISQIMVSNAVEQYNGCEEQQLPQFVRPFVCELINKYCYGAISCHLEEDGFNFKIIDDKPRGDFDSNGDDIYNTLLSGTWY